MLITNLKAKETIASLVDGKKIFVINCHGCKEVSFPEEQAAELLKELEEKGQLAGSITTDYICNPEELALRLANRKAAIDAADAVLVLSCGVGVQTVAAYLDDKRVYAACDTLHLPGHQGVTPLELDCAQCGECYLNMTAGICPITACSKSLVNGPCGGTKSGHCEVCPDMECGWERIYRKLEKLGKLDNLRCPAKLHNFATFEETKEFKEADED